ncbi:MAG: hypothetical protein MI724_15205 [Spirochaetales bacterium]|nr:hypothetical protein [Spirochaetales bacterium]
MLRVTTFGAAAVAALMLNACTQAPVTTEVRSDVRLELVEWARLAQSAHNKQPWRIVLDPADPNLLRLFIEATRLVPETDPPARQITLSAGTFLAILDARAAQLGYETTIELFPEGEYDLDTIGERPVATVTLRRNAAAEATFPVAAQIDAVTSPTIKYRYRPAELSDETIRRIENHSDGTVRFVVVQDPLEVQWLNELSVDAFTIEMEYEPTLMESYNVTRFNGRQRRRDPYGIAFTANFPRRSRWFIDGWFTLFPMSPESYGGSGIDLFTQAMDQMNTHVMMITADNSRTTQVRAGMALQAVWMEVYASGHVILANSQALQEYAAMEEPYRRIHERWAVHGETIQMLLAVAQSHGMTYTFSPRLPVERLVSDGEGAHQ